MWNQAVAMIRLRSMNQKRHIADLSMSKMARVNRYTKW